MGERWGVEEAEADGPGSRREEGAGSEPVAAEGLALGADPGEGLDGGLGEELGGPEEGPTGRDVGDGASGSASEAEEMLVSAAVAETGYGLDGPVTGADEVGDLEEDEDLAMLRRLVRDYGMRTAADRTEIGVGMLRECHGGSRELGAERVAKLVAFGQGQPDRGEERTEDGMWSEYADG